MGQALIPLKFGEIKPQGWIFNQMHKDLTEGFVGHLDELVPDLIQKDDIYGADRLTNKMKTKDLGVADKNGEFQAQYLWWNSETQSNWRDGFVRHAILMEDEEYIKKVGEYVDRMLSYQDEDGYLGIYDKDLRYNFDSENGELWAQSSLFRVLLAYYEAVGEERVLKAVERAMKVTMEAYPIYKSEPFKAKDPFAGLCHGLTIIDTLERLYKLTNKEQYMEYALWLYEDYSSHKLSEEDIQIENLMNPEYRFMGHGVHTYEHMRALITAAYYSKDLKYKTALEEYMKKLELCLCPSGGPIGDEWVDGNTADPSMNGYEYCSIQELLHSYSLLLEKSGDTKWADRIEWLLFNAGQGARHPEESSIAYLKSDNSYAMEGVFQREQPYCRHAVQTRYKYSPTHQDAAVCCVPNAGRIYPYYVQSMWMKNKGGITAVLYGPCRLETEISGVKVNLEEKTMYPFNGEIVFKISPEKPIEFLLTLRKPSFIKNYIIHAEGAEVTEDNGCIILKKLWGTDDLVTVSFTMDLRMQQDHLGDYYLSSGPLVFALPIESVSKVVKEMPIKPFRELYYTTDRDIPDYLIIKDLNIEKFEREDCAVSEDKPWQNNVVLFGSLYDERNKKDLEVKLVPMANNILRKVTFSKR